MKKILLFLMLMVSIGIQSQTTYTVINTNDSGVGSLRAAADSVIAGDTIRFSPSLIALGSDSIVLTTGEIDFDTNGVVIKGLYTVTDTLFISGNNNSRIFSFNGAGRVVLDSLVLVNGNGNGAGFGYGNGGAVYSYNCSDTLFVENSTISGNTTSSSFSGVGSGGGLYIYSSNYLGSAISVINSTISGNTAFSGAGIEIHSNDSTKVKIINSIVSGNIASSSGGGISISSSASYSPSASAYSTVSLVNSTVSGNIASSSGGGISISSSASSFSWSSYCLIGIESSTISGNTSSFGGGISCSSVSNASYAPSNCILNITNSNLLGNTASANGGGIDIATDRSYSNSSSSYPSLCNVNVTNCIISGNTANYSGGGIYSDCFLVPSIINVTNSTISGNIASSSGGGISITSSSSPCSVNLLNSTISGNTSANTFFYSGGGGIYARTSTSSSSVSIMNSTISGNTANSNGGGINSSSPISSVNVTNSTISGNTASSNGNGIYSSSSVSYSSITVASSIIAENGTGSSGIYNSHTPMIISTGYNIFSDTLSGTISSDSVNITSSQLNLQPLAFNGGITQTRRPGSGSIAIDHGNPNDSSDAQNAPIVGIRDIGATEGCFALPTSISVTQCNTTSYTVPSGNYTYTQSGIYTDTLLTACGADSVITIDLIFDTTQYAIDTIIACGSYTWVDGVTYTSNNNTAMDTLISVTGCDSIVTLYLIILQPSSGIEVVTACDSYIWNGITYTSSNNTALDTLVNAVGCDSIVTLDLTILNSTSSTEIISACDSYTSPSGNVWTNSGTYQDTMTNSIGCDSIITINLTINNTQYVTDTIVACNSHTWINGVTYISNNNTAVDTVLSSGGCDSIITLDLTILQPSTGVEVATACDSYTWNGITYTSGNNTALDTLVNAVGCDSIVTLDLTILNSTSNIETITACDSLTWIDGITYYSNNNTAQYVLTNSMGCDSVMTLDLTVNHSSTSIDSIIAVNQYTWIDGITYYFSNNSATYTLLNVDGCDSIITLNLHIDFVQVDVDQDGATLISKATFGSFQWVECPDYNIIVGATDSIFTPTSNGSYAVIVTQNGITDTSDCYAVTNVSIQEMELIGVNLYPNPTSDVLHIDKGSHQSLEIMITNSAGAIVYQSTSKKQITSIDMSKMATGIYVVTLKNELGIKVEKVVKR